MVVRYWYSWGVDEHGQPQAAVKDRPCVILKVAGEGKDRRVALAPITHSEPKAPGQGVKLSPKTQARLQLDARPQWLVTNHVNECAWPSPDLEPVRGSNPPQWSLGVVPHAIGREAARQVRRERDLGRLIRIRRDRTQERPRDQGRER